MNILKTAAIKQSNSIKAFNNNSNKKSLLKKSTLPIQRPKGVSTKTSSNFKGLQNKSIEDKQNDSITGKSPILSTLEGGVIPTLETIEGYEPRLELQSLSPQNNIQRRLTFNINYDKLKNNFSLDNNDGCTDHDDKSIQFKVAARFRPFNILENVYKYLIV
jgi:hypothetical protein